MLAALVMMLQMQQTDMLDWDETDAAEGAMPPPQMVIGIVSKDVLQLTLTKTALDVFNSLSKVCDSSQFMNSISASALTLLVGRQEDHLACKN